MTGETGLAIVTTKQLPEVVYGVTWWTFAGQKANAALAPALASLTQMPTVAGNLAIEFERALPLDTVQRAIEHLRARDPGTLMPEVSPEALEGMKFSACLPPALAAQVLGTRSRDTLAVQQVLGVPARMVSGRGRHDAGGPKIHKHF